MTGARTTARIARPSRTPAVTRRQRGPRACGSLGAEVLISPRSSTRSRAAASPGQDERTRRGAPRLSPDRGDGRAGEEWFDGSPNRRRRLPTRRPAPGALARGRPEDDRSVTGPRSDVPHDDERTW